MRRGLIVLAAAGAAALAGCGGEDRLSREEFQEQGNSICSKYEQEIDEIGTPASVEEIPAYVDKAIPIVEREIDEMRELNPPEEDQETFDELIEEAENVVEAGRELGAAAEENDEAAIEQALNEGNAASDRADEHAQELGLTACVDEEQ